MNNNNKSEMISWKNWDADYPEAEWHQGDEEGEKEGEKEGEEEGEKEGEKEGEE